MVMAVSKVTRNFQITLPKYLRRFAHIHEGDLVSFKLLKNGRRTMILIDLVDNDQAYYWTPQAQKEMALVMKEVKAGRAKKFKSVKELREYLGD